MTTTNPFHMPAPAIRHAGRQVDATYARQRMQDYVDRGKNRAMTVLKNVMEVVPQDRVLTTDQLQFRAFEPGAAFTTNSVGGLDGEVIEVLKPELIVTYHQGDRAFSETMHRNALGQLAGRFEIPMGYVDHMMGKGKWGREHLARDLQAHADNIEDRYLIRSVAGEARAVLSDKFRRIDCRPTALALMEVAQARGLVVSDGHFTETRTSLKFILPQVIEPIPGEYMVFGMDWSNSDFGRGANDLRMFFFRLVCWNGAVGESVARQVHIGRRLEEDVSYSEKTYKLDAEATASALRDQAAHVISEARISRLIEGIRTANGKAIDGKAQTEALKKKGATKADTEAVVEAFRSANTTDLPAGDTMWRWSNAISFVAQGLPEEQNDKRIDLERWAGEVLQSSMPKNEEPAA